MDIDPASTNPISVNEQQTAKLTSNTASPPKTNLRFFCINAGGIRSKLIQLLAAVATCDYDVIIILESWLVASIPNEEFTPSGWCTYRCDRHQSIDARNLGGGILIMVRSELLSSCFNVAEEHNAIEQLWISIILTDRTLYVGGAYIPPRSDDAAYEVFTSSCHDMYQKAQTQDDVLLFCDLNLPRIKWVQHDENDSVFVPTGLASDVEINVADTVSEGFFQLNGHANSFGNFLDTVFCSRYDDVELTCPAPPLCTGLGSTNAHNPLSIVYAVQLTPPANKPSSASFDFKRADFGAIINHLEYLDWDTVLDYSNIDDMVNTFYSHLHHTIEFTVPKKISRLPKSRPWMSSALKRLRNKRRAAGARAKRTKSFYHFNEYERLNKLFNDCNENEFVDFFRRQGEKLKTDPKKFWEFVDKLRNNRALPKLMTYDLQEATEDSGIANLLTSHFKRSFTVHDQLINNALAFNPTGVINNADALSSHFTELEVFDALCRLDPSKGAGPDGLPPRFWKEAASALAKPLTIIFNKSIFTGTFPSLWKQATVVAVHKSGLRSKAENYRPISMLSCPAN
jgi:hypothetical protein